jgi:outer membrane protein assembly factor BamD
LNLKRLMNITALALLLAFAACSRGPRPVRPRVDPELMSLSKEQIFQKAEDLFKNEKWTRSRTYYSHLYENYPNDPLGRRSFLRIADTFFNQGDPVNLVEAQYKYRDFLNRFPGSEYADYAMLQIAMVSYKQMEKPDRDQQKTREAVEKFNDMIKAFPRSELRPEAEKRLGEARDRLARHEHIVARFYMKRRSYNAAVQRLNYLIDEFSNYSERDAAFFDLGTSLAALGRTGEARLYFERVVSEFPKSGYAEKAKRRLDDMKA